MAHYLAQPAQPAQPAPGATSRTVSSAPQASFWTDYLKSANAVAYNPVNYFDAWSLSKDGFKSQDNADVKAVYGLPATGPGPGRQGPNPRAGQLECTGA